MVKPFTFRKLKAPAPAPSVFQEEPGTIVIPFEHPAHHRLLAFGIRMQELHLSRSREDSVRALALLDRSMEGYLELEEQCAAIIPEWFRWDVTQQREVSRSVTLHDLQHGGRKLTYREPNTYTTRVVPGHRGLPTADYQECKGEIRIIKW